MSRALSDTKVYQLYARALLGLQAYAHMAKHALYKPPIARLTPSSTSASYTRLYGLYERARLGAISAGIRAGVPPS